VEQLQDSEDFEPAFARWCEGQPVDFSKLCAAVYPELKQIARQQLRRRGSPAGLDTTALVHEGVLAVLERRPQIKNHQHLQALVALSMRSVLLDTWRAEYAQKRGGGTAPIPLSELGDQIAAESGGIARLSEIESAMRALEHADARAARVVTMVSFGGMAIDVVADVMRLSSRSIERDLKFARAFLQSELKP
jgi:RNA polymerase sigma factor (TIGR02999 family)